MKYLEFVPHSELDSAIGVHASAYREKNVDSRHLPEPAYGILERMDDIYVLRRNDGNFTKLEEGEGVFII